MAETIRDVTIRVGLKQVDAKLRVPEVQPVTAAFEKVEQSVNGVQKKLKQTNNAVEQLGTQSVDNALKMNEGFRTAGEGAFTLARGIAFIGASTEEEMAEAIKTIAAVQGAFDAFKGSLDVVKGLTEGIRALRAASTAAAVSERGLAAANAAVATTGAAATVSMSGLVATLGPIALAAAAAGAAFLLFRKNQLEPTSDAVDDFEERISSLGGTLERFRLQRTGGFDEQTASRQISVLRQTAELAERRARAVSLEAQGRETRSDITELNLLRQQLSFVDDQADAQREILTILEQQRRLKEDLVRKATEELDKARRLAEVEQSRARSIKENLSLQDPLEQARTKAILQRFQAEGAGALSRQELDVVRGVGARGVATRELVNRADQGLLALGQSLAAQESQLQAEADKRARDDVEGDPRVFEQRVLRDAARTAVDATDRATGQVLGLLEELVSRQRALEDTVNRLEGGLQRGAALSG